MPEWNLAELIKRTHNHRTNVKRFIDDAILISHGLIKMNRSYEQNMETLLTALQNASVMEIDIAITDLRQSIILLKSAKLLSNGIDSNNEVLSLLLKIKDNMVNPTQRQHIHTNRRGDTWCDPEARGIFIAGNKLMDAILWISEYSTICDLPK